MKKFIIVLYVVIFMSFCVLLLTNCRTPIQTAVSTKDSISYIERIVRDTTVLPADSSWLSAYFKCDSLGNVYINQINDLKTAGINTVLNFNKGNLIYKTFHDTVRIIIPTKNITSTNSHKADTVVTVTIVKMNLFQKIFFWIGLIASVFCIGYIIGKLTKKI